MKDIERQKRNQAAWYQANKEKVKARQESKRVENRDIVLEAFKSGCVDCGNTDIRVLEFDHLPEFDKSFGISRALRGAYASSKLIEEIAKCEVVCANCHRIRTRTRDEDWRTLV